MASKILRLLKLSLLMGAAGLLALLPGCTEGNVLLSPTADDELVVEGEGTVRFHSIEGGCWTIASDAGNTLEPVNLPEAFQQDKLRVHFRAEITNDLVTFCEIGTIVRIRQIDRL